MYQGYPSESDLEEKRKRKYHQEEISTKRPGQRLQKIFRDAAETRSVDVQKRTDAILETKEGKAELERYKSEVLTLEESGVEAPSERLNIYHRHSQNWAELEKQYDRGELTPLEK